MENIRDSSSGRMSREHSRVPGDGTSSLSSRRSSASKNRKHPRCLCLKKADGHADILMGDGWSIAYRLMDAQGWRVPQRRRRIYLVADFAGSSAEQILFDTESVRRDLAPCFAAWQGTAREFADGTGTSSDRLSAGFCTEHSAKSRSIGYAEEQSPTLRAETVPAVFESHGSDARYNGPIIVRAGTISCLSSRTYRHTESRHSNPTL